MSETLKPSPDLAARVEALRFRKKPVVIKARELTHETAQEVMDWCGSKKSWTKGPFRAVSGIIIPTLEGEHQASWGDWIIRGIKGEFYPCAPDIFAATYEPVATPSEPRQASAVVKRIVTRLENAQSDWFACEADRDEAIEIVAEEIAALSRAAQPEPATVSVMVDEIKCLALTVGSPGQITISAGLARIVRLCINISRAAQPEPATVEWMPIETVDRAQQVWLRAPGARDAVWEWEPDHNRWQRGNGLHWGEGEYGPVEWMPVAPPAPTTREAGR